MIELQQGKHYFFRKDRRTDGLAHKRYTHPCAQRWESVIIMGEVILQRGGEVKIAVTDTEMLKPDPMDGDLIVMPVGDVLTVTGGEPRTLEEHGRPGRKLGAWFTADDEQKGD